MVDRLGIVAQRAVIAARRPFVGEACRQLQPLGDLGRGEAMIEQPHGLVVDELVEVALLFEEGDDRALPPIGQ